MELREVKLTNIIQGQNARSTYYKDDMSELMQSIQKSGLLQPIGVKKVGRKFEVIFGNRRFLACQKLDYSTIKALVFDKMSEDEELVAHIVENIQRKNITSFDLGRYVHLAQTKLKMNPEEAAVRLGVSKARIKDALKVFNGIPDEHRSSVKSITVVNKRGGDIPATLAALAINARKANKINTKELGLVIAAIKEFALTGEQLRRLLELVAGGMKVSLAVKDAKEVMAVSTRVVLPKKIVKKLENMHDKSIRTLMIEAFYKTYAKEIGKRYSFMNRVNKGD